MSVCSARALALVVGILLLFCVPAARGAQAPSAAQGSQQTQDNQETPRFRLPTITVTAQKEPEKVEDAPVAVTAVTADVLDGDGIRTISEASAYAPNTFFSEFTARKLSFPRFRGIGASPNNPGVATFIDGVPQFNANSSSIELLDIGQIEFVRGPQSALFGRNAIGGLINIRSAPLRLDRWAGSIVAPFGNFATADVRAAASGPLVSDRVALGVSFGYSSRDGFTRNDITGHDVDSRSAYFAKGHVLWVPAANWEARFLLTGERARDGDYALNDLGALRARPFHVARDFEGYTHRDLVAPTVLLHHAGKVDFSTVTGVVWWKTDDLTDLDYTPLPLLTRKNAEKDTQFTQEVRFASTKDSAVRLSDQVTLRWQGGLFVFTQDYTQDAVNNFSPYILSQFIAFPVAQHSPQSSLDDRGVGVYGQGTFAIRDRLDLTVGIRGDHESKRAALDTFYAPAIAPASTVNAKAGFSDASPQFTASYRVTPSRVLVYATAARGFKAGGFNAASPIGGESYGEEHSWNYEGGAKTMWFANRLSMNAALFHVNWQDLQVNVPNPAVPGQFFISNAAGAATSGGEIELGARLLPECDFFGAFGYTSAHFDQGSTSNGIRVGGNRLANTPRYTADFGGQYSLPLSARTSLYGRADFIFRSDYEYDDANTAGQDAYSLANFRGGVRDRRLFVEAWVHNAFDTRYIPVAFAYPGLAPSGFVGESGAPRTFGVRAGVTF